MSTEPSQFEEPVPLASAAVPQDERNGLAVAALVLGILGLAFPPAGLVGLILGIIGVVQAKALPSRKGRRAAIAGICCGGVSVLMLPAITLPILLHARELSRRAACAANLKGISAGLHVYANDNSGWFPIAPFAQATSMAGNANEVTFIGQMANNLMARNAPADQSTVHPSRSLFMLIIDGTLTPDQFICPSSGDTEDDMRAGAFVTPVAADPGLTRYDFRGYPYLSYGYQLPFGPHAQPSENLDPRMAIMADKGPFFQAGAGATGYESWTARDTIRPGSGAVQPGGEISIGLTDATEILKADNDQWRPYNSPNHNREGECVLYQDGHVRVSEETNRRREPRQHIHDPEQLHAGGFPARQGAAGHAGATDRDRLDHHPVGRWRSASGATPESGR